MHFWEKDVHSIVGANLELGHDLLVDIKLHEGQQLRQPRRRQLVPLLQFPETVKSDGARHMGSTVRLGLWVKGEREAAPPSRWCSSREGEEVVAGEGGGRAVCQR